MKPFAGIVSLVYHKSTTAIWADLAAGATPADDTCVNGIQIRFTAAE